MGCILYEMCACRVPFDAADLKSLITKITRGPTPAIPDQYSDSLRELAGELLNREAQSRPPCEVILKKPVVREMVRKMLNEVKEEGTAAGGSDGSRPSAAP